MGSSVKEVRRGDRDRGGSIRAMESRRIGGTLNEPGVGIAIEVFSARREGGERVVINNFFRGEGPKDKGGRSECGEGMRGDIKGDRGDRGIRV